MYTNLSSLQEFVLLHSQVLWRSYKHWLGNELVPGANEKQLAEVLFDAPFALVSHDAQADPVFNYANRRAQELFGFTWQEFTRLPSRLSAGPVDQHERALFLLQVTHSGYAEGYKGVRIAKDGSQFEIRNATLWNLVDDEGRYCGQAAVIPDWRRL